MAKFLDQTGLAYFWGKLKALIPTKTSELTNDSGFITGYTETDPTVPSWAKASSKPSYTASEVGAVPTSRTVNGKALSANISLSASDVGALPDDTAIPSKTSDLTNDSGFITGYTETDPTVPAWAKASTKPTYTYSEVGAASSGHTHSNYVPTSRTVNGKALSSNITLSASDVGAGASTVVTTATLSASGWSGSTYSGLQTTYPSASYDIEIEPNGDSCTAAQYSAWGAAQLVGSATTNILTALGTVPTVDIPIIVKYTPK